MKLLTPTLMARSAPKESQPAFRPRCRPMTRMQTAACQLKSLPSCMRQMMVRAVQMHDTDGDAQMTGAEMATVAAMMQSQMDSPQSGMPGMDQSMADEKWHRLLPAASAVRYGHIKEESFK